LLGGVLSKVASLSIESIIFPQSPDKVVGKKETHVGVDRKFSSGSWTEIEEKGTKPFYGRGPRKGKNRPCEIWKQLRVHHGIQRGEGG